MVLLNLTMCEHGMSVCSEFSGICGFFFFNTRISFLKLLLFYSVPSKLFSSDPVPWKPALPRKERSGQGCLIVPGCWGSWKLGPAVLQKILESVSVQWQSNFCCDMWDFGVDSCHHLIGMWLFQRKVGLCQHRETKVIRIHAPEKVIKQTVPHIVELSVRNGSSVLCPCQSDRVDC